MADVDVEEQWAARRQLSRIGLAVIGLSLGFSAGQPAAAALLELFLWHTHTHCTALLPHTVLLLGGGGAYGGVPAAAAAASHIPVDQRLYRASSSQPPQKRGT